MSHIYARYLGMGWCFNLGLVIFPFSFVTHTLITQALAKGWSLFPDVVPLALKVKTGEAQV